MNAEELRRLCLLEVLDELTRAIELARNAVVTEGSMWGTWLGNGTSQAPMPLVTLGDFDIYPRDEVRRELAKRTPFLEPWG